MNLSALDNILFGLNALAYLLLFCWYWYHDRCLNLRTFITLLYAGSAMFAPYVYKVIDPSFYNGIQVGNLTFWPFVYLFIMYLLLLSPLFHRNIQGIQQFEFNNPRLLNVLTWFIVGIYGITILFSNVKLTDLLSIDQLMQNYADTLNNTIDGYKVDVSPIERFTSIFKGAFTDLVILLLIYHILTQQKAGIAAMVICLGYNVIYNLSIGQRAIILEIILSFVFVFLIARHAMAESTRRHFSISIITFGVIAVMAFSVLTFARFSERDNSVADYVLTYYSESWYIFNNHGLDPGGCRYGDFTAPLIRRMMGKPCTNTMFESIDTFTTMHTNCSVFNTVIGDFTMDYGAIWTTIMMILYVILMRHALPGEETDAYPFARLIILFIAWRIASIGFIAFSYRGIGGNIQLVTDIILYFFLRNRYVLKR